MKKNGTMSIGVIAFSSALAVGLAGLQGQVAKPSRYTITDLGTLG